MGLLRSYCAVAGESALDAAECCARVFTVLSCAFGLTLLRTALGPSPPRPSLGPSDLSTVVEPPMTLKSDRLKDLVTG